MDPDFFIRGSRNMSMCSEESLDERHRFVNVIVGVKTKERATFAIEDPLLMLISGGWTPLQVWNEYCAKLGHSNS
jgi:hypothetical protein